MSGKENSKCFKIVILTKKLVNWTFCEHGPLEKAIFFNGYCAKNEAQIEVKTVFSIYFEIYVQKTRGFHRMPHHRYFGGLKVEFHNKSSKIGFTVAWAVVQLLYPEKLLPFQVPFFNTYNESTFTKISRYRFLKALHLGRIQSFPWQTL